MRKEVTFDEVELKEIIKKHLGLEDNQNITLYPQGCLFGEAGIHIIYYE